jgi:hypothetical protein
MTPLLHTHDAGVAEVRKVDAAPASAAQSASPAPASTPASATTTAAPAATTRTPGSAPSSAPAPARPRGELSVGVGVHGGATDWAGDPLGYGSFDIGLRLWRVVTPYVGAALGYARIDQRLLTRLTLGVGFGVTLADRFRPRGYVAFVHQHEESLASVAQQPFGAVLGIGNGIRHRAGVHVGVAFDFVLYRTPTSALSLGPDLSFMYLTYSSGPSWFFTAGILAAGHFRLF